LNSGKVLDVTGMSLDNGAYLQQWDWWGGLNQQWQIVPVQDDYQATGYTDIYYDPGSYSGWAIASTDADYSTQYYYGNQISLEVDVDGNLANSGLWGYEPDQIGFGSAYAGFNASPGDYVEAGAWYSLVTQYEWYQITSACGPFCYSWYDPFNYDFVEENPGEGTTIPTWYSNVWATIVIGVGQTGSRIRIPASAPDGVFDLKIRAFIAPAWIWGAGFPWDFCTDSAGNYHNVIYQGDNRTYTAFSNSFRAQGELYVSAWSGSAWTAPSGGPFKAGTTTRYAEDARAPDGYTLIGDSVYNDCHLTDKIVPGSIDPYPNSGYSVSGGSGSVTANIWVSSTNMATKRGPDLTPSINWNVTYTIDAASNPAIPTWTLEYTHDCFPAYEMYIGAQLLYRFTPTDNSARYIAFCLAGVNQVQDTKIGTVN
jgi:hypothetical protein